jgi:protein TonB
MRRIGPGLCLLLSLAWLLGADACGLDSTPAPKSPKPPPASSKPNTTEIMPAPEVVDSTGLPAQGDYVYVKELPEALEKVAPIYPEAARAARIDGTVMVQALVGKDGSVRDVRVVKSIPELDGAAKECVRQWKFRPAKDDHGQPLTVWVAVPIKFSLH